MSSHEQTRAKHRAILSRPSGNATVDLHPCRRHRMGGPSERPVSLRCVQARQRPQSSDPPRLGSSILTQRQKSKEPPKAGGPAGAACGAALFGLVLPPLDLTDEIVDAAPR